MQSPEAIEQDALVGRFLCLVPDGFDVGRDRFSKTFSATWHRRNNTIHGVCGLATPADAILEWGRVYHDWLNRLPEDEASALREVLAALAAAVEGKGSKP